MTSLLCDFGLRGKRNKRFHGERYRENGFCKIVLGERVAFFVFQRQCVESIDTSFFKATVRLDAQIPNSYQIPNS